jgi:hypothetical protein
MRDLPGKAAELSKAHIHLDGYAGLLASVRRATRSIGAAQTAAAMFGLAGPLAIGAFTGHRRIGMAASLGGLALSRGERGGSVRERAIGSIYSVTAGSAAMLVGTTLGVDAVRAAVVIPVIAAAAGLLGSISRPLARATALFMLFLIIAAHLGAGGTAPAGMTFLFLLGAVCTAGLSLALRRLLRALDLTSAPRPVPPPAKRYTMRQLLRRWRKSLKHLSGWQYVLRITVCLAAGQALVAVWPLRHGYWVALTIMIVVQRDLRSVLTRTLHRATGTFLGVLITGILLLGHWPLWAVAAFVAVLAAARPALMEVSYTAYAAVQTPLIILLLDFGKAPTQGVVIDRLAATLAGCCLALTFGYIGWSRLAPAEAVRSDRHGTEMQTSYEGGVP